MCISVGRCVSLECSCQRSEVSERVSQSFCVCMYVDHYLVFIYFNTYPCIVFGLSFGTYKYMGRTDLAMMMRRQMVFGRIVCEINSSYIYSSLVMIALSYSSRCVSEFFKFGFLLVIVIIIACDSSISITNRSRKRNGSCRSSSRGIHDCWLQPLWRQ